MSKQQVRDTGEELSKRQRKLKEQRERGKAKQRRKNITGPLAIVIGAVLLVGILIYPSLQPLDLTLPPPAEHPLADGNSMGDPDAPVQIVEYSNFTCSHCSDFFAESEAMLIEDYVKTGKVHFTYQPYVSPQDPLGGFQAAEAAFCAGDQGKFWDMHDVLFSNFNFAIQNNGFSSRSLDAMAEHIGLDMDAFGACMDDGTYQAAVNDASAEGSAAGVNGTPTFFINGVSVVGNDPQGLIREIESALASTAE